MNSFNKNISSLINSAKIYKRHIKYARHFKQLLCLQHLDETSSDGEKEYVNLWKKLYHCVEPYSYRFFRHYCGDTPYIVPEDIGHSFIEPKLNPKRFTPFYEDKNILSLLLPDGYVPCTILSRMQGGAIFNNDRQKVAINKNTDAESLFAIIGGGKMILKPSLDSSSGRRVMAFVPDKNKYVSSDGKVLLDGAFLLNYGSDWVLQSAVEQHASLNHLCSSCVNTIRINTYRSFKDEQVYILSAAIRIGHEGSVVDNLHAGGGFVGIDVMTGELGHEVLDQYGSRTKIHNGIDYSNEHFSIPNWEKVVHFAKDVAYRNPHCRLIALDIAIKADGTPILIEWNVTPYSFSYWIPMMTGVTPFGDKTEEIIEYCINR